jgi:DinB family protein
MDKEVQATPAWPDRIIEQLDAADLRVHALADRLTADQLNWRPSPQEWSIGQCLQHLLEFNREYGAAIPRALDGKHPSPVREVKIPRLSGWFMRNYVEPGPSTRRVRSPKKIQPDTQISPSVLNDFLQSNQQAKDLVRKAAAFNVNRIRYKNPLAPLIRFTVGVGFELTWKHELRHILQAERVRKSPEFPSSL